MCDKCRNRESQTPEDRIKALEVQMSIVLQASSQFLDDLVETKDEMERAHKAFRSFMLRVMKEVPTLRAEFEEYVDGRASHVGTADQVKAALRDILDKP